MWLKIVQVGDPVLRQRARDLTDEELGAPALAQLIALMRDTMRDAPGVGLAAPQVGVPLRLAVVEDPESYQEGVDKEELDARERAPVPFQVLINPRLTVEDATPVEHFEGCLSLSGFSALVPRARAVRVDALDENGEPIVVRARGWHARILQHELDHLDGTIYIDRMVTRSFMSSENAGRFWSQRSLADIRAGLDLDRK